MLSDVQDRADVLVLAVAVRLKQDLQVALQESSVSSWPSCEVCRAHLLPRAAPGSEGHLWPRACPGVATRGAPSLAAQADPVWVFWPCAAADVKVGVRIFRGGVQRLVEEFGPGLTGKEAGEWLKAEFDRRR